jgi:hypothetical protein
MSGALADMGDVPAALVVSAVAAWQPSKAAKTAILIKLRMIEPCFPGARTRPASALPRLEGVGLIGCSPVWMPSSEDVRLTLRRYFMDAQNGLQL